MVVARGGGARRSSAGDFRRRRRLGLQLSRRPRRRRQAGTALEVRRQSEEIGLEDRWLRRPEQSGCHAGGLRRPRLHRRRRRARLRRGAGLPVVHRPDETRRREPRAGRRQTGQADLRRPAASRRICAIDESAGETLRPNPNSAAVWRYTGFDANGNGKLDFEETMHRSISMAVIKDGLLVIADLSGRGPLPGRQDRQGPLDARPDVADLGIALRGRRQNLHRRPGRRRGGVRAFVEAEAAGEERDGRRRSTARRSWPTTCSTFPRPPT